MPEQYFSIAEAAAFFKLSVGELEIAQKLFRLPSKDGLYSLTALKGMLNHIRSFHPKTFVEPDAPRFTVRQAYKSAAAKCANLIFALNKKSDLATPFDDAQTLLQAFFFLNDICQPALLNRSMDKFALDEKLKALVGNNWHYRTFLPGRAMDDYPEWYSTILDGRTVWTNAYIKKGVAFDPRYTIRLSFSFDFPTKKIVVGYLGIHQKTNNN